MNRNSQAKGVENAEKLEAWIRATPLSKVPLNSHGESAKRTICLLLNIPRSTIGTNSAIEELFSKLDAKLLKRKDEAKVNNENRGQVELSSADLAYVLAELERLRASNARLRHLDGTGIFIPEK